MKTCKELAEGAIARGKILRRRRKKAVAAISVTVCVCLLTGVPLLLRTPKATSTLPEGEGEWYEDGSVVMEEPQAPNVTAEKNGESETHTVPAPPDEGPCRRKPVRPPPHLKKRTRTPLLLFTGLLSLRGNRRPATGRSETAAGL